MSTTTTSEQESLDDNILTRLWKWAEERPNQLAFRFLLDGKETSKELSFGELADRVHAVASELTARGARGERALLLYPPGLDFITAFLGCLAAEVIAVPAYPPTPARLSRTLPRLQAITKDADSRLVLTTSSAMDLASMIREQAAEFECADWLATDSISKTNSGFVTPKIASDAIAFLQYTSGSTGTPKGVMVSHGNLTHNSECIRRSFALDAAVVGVGWLPLYHDMGLIGQVLHPLFLGRPCTLMSPLDFLKRPERWLGAISKYRATASGAPNFAYDLCVKKVSAEAKRELDLSSWQVAFVGAEPVREDTLNRFAEAFAACGFRRESFLPCYGLAENTLMTTGSRHTVVKRVSGNALAEGRAELADDDDKTARRLVSLGAAAHDQQVLVVDPERRTECDQGAVGEIWVRGQSTAQGYWRQPVESERVFRARLAGSVEPTYLRTGDLGFLDRGQLYVAGRLKDVIILLGKNHYPEDIERSVEHSHALIRPGCVAAFSTDLDGNERLVVAAEVEIRRRGREVDDQLRELTVAIRRSIAEVHEVQPYVVALLRPGGIPKTSSGKLARHACRTAFLENTLDPLEIWSAASLDASAIAQAPIDVELYPDLAERLAKPDRRNTRYQFDLERDIAWDRIADEGLYFGPAYLKNLGIDPQALEQNPEAHKIFQWALALATCETFADVEENMIRFTRREEGRIGASRSLRLFQEEEEKHTVLFTRYAAFLRQQQPQLTQRIQPYLEACVSHRKAATTNELGLDEPMLHYKFWLYVTLLEECTIHLYDQLAPDGAALNAAWLSAHAAHRREEIQHVVTDMAHVRALALADDERQRVSKLWFNFYASHWGQTHGLEAAYRLLAETHPEVAAQAIPYPRLMPPAYFEQLRAHRTFARSREAVPYLGQLAELPEEEALRALTQAYESRHAGAAKLGHAQPTALSLQLGASGHRERRHAVLHYLIERIALASQTPVESIHVDLHLLDAGLDSVSGADLVARVEADLGVSVPLAAVFNSTIDSLTGYIVEQADQSSQLARQ